MVFQSWVLFKVGVLKVLFVNGGAKTKNKLRNVVVHGLPHGSTVDCLVKDRFFFSGGLVEDRSSAMSGRRPWLCRVCKERRMLVNVNSAPAGPNSPPSLKGTGPRVKPPTLGRNAAADRARSCNWVELQFVFYVLV